MKATGHFDEVFVPAPKRISTRMRNHLVLGVLLTRLGGFEGVRMHKLFLIKLTI